MPVDPPIRESGHVLRTDGPVAVIEIHRASACVGCAASGVCHTLGGASDQHELRARNAAGAEPGDLVDVEIPASEALRAAALVYLLPTVLVIVVAVASHTLATRMGVGEPADLISASSALLALCLFALAAWWRSTRAGSGPHLERLPVVVRRQPRDEAPADDASSADR